MTPDQIDLARRAVACKGWRWMAGMTAIPLSHERERWLLCWCEEDGSEAGGYQTTGGKWWGIATSDLPMVLREGWVPDLTDPATLGCLLALVREAWGDPRIHSAPGLYAHDAAPEYRYQIAHWHVYSPGPYNALTEPPKCSVTALTEAGALVKALEAAP